jgi:hypothetical protein
MNRSKASAVSTDAKTASALTGWGCLGFLDGIVEEIT